MAPALSTASSIERGSEKGPCGLLCAQFQRIPKTNINADVSADWVSKVDDVCLMLQLEQE